MLYETTTHAAEAKALLIDYFKKLDDWESLLDSWVAQVQEIEAMLFDLLEDRVLDTAVGEQLDVLGRIVGQDRGGLDDDDFRLWIRARMLTNKSSGTAEQLSVILNLIVSNNFHIYEWFPASMTIVIDDELTATTTLIADIISEARSAGIGCTVDYTLTDDDYTFTFATGDTAEADSDRGWSNDGGTSGGKFADCEEA